MMNADAGQKKYSKAKAQSLVEFAIILPILLLLLLGAMDFGRLFYTKIVLTNAAREGAYYIAYNKEDCAAGYTGTWAAIAAEADSSTVALVPADVTYTGACTSGSPIVVTISTPVDLIFDGVLQTFGAINGPVHITSSVEMMVQ